MEAVENAQDRVAVPDPVTVVGETEHEVLFVVRDTVPPKPLSGVIVSVDEPVAPALTVMDVGLAVRAKS